MSDSDQLRERPITTAERIAVVEEAIKALAAGTTVDWNTLSDEGYEAAAEKCAELSRYLDSIAESFLIAASPECTALLAEVCKRMESQR